MKTLKILLLPLVLVCSVYLYAAAVSQEAFLASLSSEEQEFLASHPSFTFLSDPAWAPLEYQDAQGKAVGLSKDYLDAVSDLTGIQFIQAPVSSWQEGYEQLLRGAIDLTTSLTPTAERIPLLLFTKPYLTVPLAIIAGQQVGYLGSLAELGDRPVAVVRGYGAQQWIHSQYPSIPLVLVDTVEQGLLAVKAGNAYCMVENLLVANHYIQKLRLFDNLKVVGTTTYINELSIAVQKDYPLLVSILDKALACIDAGQREQLYRKNLPNMYAHVISQRTLNLMYATTFVVLLVVIFWMYTLVREIKKREVAEGEKKGSEARFKTLFESAPMPQVLLGFDGKVMMVNQQWRTYFRYEPGDIPNLESWYEKAYPDPEYRTYIRQEWEREVASVLQKKLTHIEPMECIITTKTGETYTMEISGTPLSDYILVTFFDITEHTQAMQQLEVLNQQAEQSRQIILSALEDQKLLQQSIMRSNATLDAAIKSMTDGVFILDMHAHFILINQAFLAYYRFDDDALCPKDLHGFSALFETFEENGGKRAMHDWAGFRALAGETGTDQYFVHKLGTALRWFGSYSYAPILDEDGNQLGAVVVCRDITQVKEAANTLLYQRNHDYLTGLYSRAYFEAELLNQNDIIPLTMGMVDVNGLKVVNDSFGHEMGDSILKKTAQLLSQQAEEHTIIARYGGDEFVFLMLGQTMQAAQAYMQRIDAAANQVAIQSFHLSLSFGYATRYSLDENMQQVMKQAEDMMNRNKIYENASAKNKSIALVINSLFAKSNRESQHSRRVSELSGYLASCMKLPQWEVNRIKVAGLMHDIGKIGVEEAILNKPGALDEEEWKHMRRHPEIGYRILSASSEFSDLGRSVLEHHERWDGNGYPRGLKGEQISLQARIINIADSYDAMTNERSYKKPMTKAEALGQIKQNAGLQFDPAMADLFVSAYEGFSGGKSR